METDLLNGTVGAIADPIPVGIYIDADNPPSTNTIVMEVLLSNQKYAWDLPKFQENDWVSLGLTDQDDQVGVVSNIEYKDTGNTNECTVIVDVEFNTLPTFDVNGTLYLHSPSHRNGETEAFFRGPVDETLWTPIDCMAVDDTNIDYVATDTQCYSNNRLNTQYSQIKNSEHWDYYYTSDANPLYNFNPKSKIKFFSKNPSKNKIEIAIANWYDFKDEYDDNGDPYNHSIAFRTPVGNQYENMYLKDLFSYYPSRDQIALIIKYGEEIETYIVSFDPESVDGNNKSNYIETVINEQSNLVYCLENKSIADMPASYLVCDRYGLDKVRDCTDPGDTNPGTPTTTIMVQGGKSPKCDVGSIRDAYFTVEDKEKYEIDVIIGNEVIYKGGDDLNIAIDLSETRKDCIAYVGARYMDTVGKKANDATNAIVKYITKDDTTTGSKKLTRSMFAAFFGNYFRIYDAFNKKFRWINVAGDMAGIRCSVTNDNAAWWVSAGMKRGIIRNIDKMAFTPSQPQRDTLYKNGINPLVTFPGTGNLVWGNKTLLPYSSSFDRINVRNLFNELERAMAKAAKSQVFEFNDPYTRNAILAMFNPYLSSIQAGRGITEYLVICDETNNTPDVISRNELRVDIFIKHTYSAEFIHLNFVNAGSRSISEIVAS